LFLGEADGHGFCRFHGHKMNQHTGLVKYHGIVVSWYHTEEIPHVEPA
jgi:hypothetical protein